jgi:antitoxin Phd
MSNKAKSLVTMAEANENFSKVALAVDKEGVVIILREGIPSYALTRFSDYVPDAEIREALLSDAIDLIMEENAEALSELAK